MAPKSLHTWATTIWIGIANLLADEPYAPLPDVAELDLLDRVTGRLRKIPLSNWPMGLLGRFPGTTLLTRTEADVEVDPKVVYELAYSVATALAKVLSGFSDPDLARKGQILAMLPRRFAGDAVLLEASGRVRILPVGDYARFLDDLALIEDVRRIRRCQICPRFFFADRTDQTTCSRSHAKTLSMQKWRDGRGKDYAQRRKSDLYARDEAASPGTAKRG